MIKNSRLILVPIIISFVFSLSYILIAPGNIKGDAIEYDGLANSILKGEYSLDGLTSMEREPGYPLFRAAIKLVSENPKAILFFQLVIFCLTIYVIGLTCLLIDPERGMWGYFGASLSYGLAFYTSTHISEVFIAFLLSLVGLTLIKGIRNPETKYWIYLSILSSLLILTRYPYILVPIVSLFLLIKSSRENLKEKKEIIRNVIISFIILTAFLSPWIIRNYMRFGEINIAGRSGAGLYARAWKAEKSWQSLRDSYLSALMGRGILFTIYPSNQSIWLEQWGDWWRNPEVAKLRGDTPTLRDRYNKKIAKEIILKNTENASRFIVWSGVDLIRFFQLPNPMPEAYGASFEGTFGPLAKENTITKLQLLALSVVHVIQVIWFVVIPLSLYFGFKKYKYKFLPGIFVLSVILVHSIADNVTRYSAPLLPWILAGIFMTIIFPIFIKLKKFSKTNSA